MLCESALLPADSVEVEESKSISFLTEGDMHLDIDLDYFSCFNPFLKDVLSAFGEESTAKVKAMFSELHYKTVRAKDMTKSLHEKCLKSAALFEERVAQIFREKMYTLDSSDYLLQLADLIQLYPSNEIGVKVVVSYSS